MKFLTITPLAPRSGLCDEDIDGECLLSWNLLLSRGANTLLVNTKYQH